MDITNSFTVKNYNDEPKTLAFQKVRELKDGMTVEQAAELTKDNGMDELFFECEGKQYVAFTSDSMENIQHYADKGITNNGKAINVLKFNDEANSLLSGAWDMTKTLGRAVVMKPYQALKPVLPNAATAGTFLGGVALGALTRAGEISVPTRIGLAIGAAGGVGTVRHITDKTSDATAKTVKAALTGAASVGIGAAMPEVVRLIAKIPIPEFVPKAAALVGTAALVGSAIAITGGAIAGATKKADMTTIDHIAK